MKTILSALLLTITTTALVGCGGNELMRDAYEFDKSTYDYVEVIIDGKESKRVAYGTGGRNCEQTWYYENDKIVRKGTRECTDYKPQN